MGCHETPHRVSHRPPKWVYFEYWNKTVFVALLVSVPSVVQLNKLNFSTDGTLTVNSAPSCGRKLHQWKRKYVKVGYNLLKNSLPDVIAHLQGLLFSVPVVLLVTGWQSECSLIRGFDSPRVRESSPYPNPNSNSNPRPIYSMYMTVGLSNSQINGPSDYWYITVLRS